MTTQARFRFTAATSTFDPSAAMRQAQEIVGDEWTVTAAPVDEWWYAAGHDFPWTAEVIATAERVAP